MISYLWGLTGVVLFVFLMDWLAVVFSWRKIEIVLKPLAMVLVTLWTLNAAGWAVESLIFKLVFAQVFGLAGDIFLLLNARWFLMGLGAFLLGHLVYILMMGSQIIAAVEKTGLPSNWARWLAAGFVVWGLLLAVFYKIIAPKSPRLTMPLMLWIPIQVYGWILSGLVVMSILLIATMERVTIGLIILLVGTLLFFLSDSLLAYDRFKRKMPRVRVWIMITYHLAQFTLAAGFLVIRGYF